MEGIFEGDLWNMTGTYFEYRNVVLTEDIQGFDRGHRFQIAWADHGIRTITFVNENEELIVRFTYEVSDEE